tara:strand:- start:54 stop:458 length:405 start_codon:yes stop_codon:yes gene_type:complete
LLKQKRIVYLQPLSGCSVARLSRLLWEQEAAGSNPATPTKTFLYIKRVFLFLQIMFYVYILYSKSIDKFYIGYTAMELCERLRRHLSSHKGFTSRAKDWEFVYFELIEDKTKAILREKEIKNWKSSAKIMELIS